MAQADETRQSGKEQWNTRVEPDMSADLHDYREKHDLTKSDAAKRLLQDGLESRSTMQQHAHDLKQLADHLASLGLVAFIATAFWPSGGILPGLTLGLTFATVAASSYLISYHVKVTY